jgi:predicted transposase YdaD
MAEIDTVSKHLIQTYPADFARFALQRDDIKDVEVLESEQPIVKARRTDSLLRVHIGDKKALVHTEFQTTDHPAMPRRMAGYIGWLVEHYGLPVYAHVFYLRPTAGRRDPGYYMQEHPDYPVVIRYKVIRLSQLAGQAVLDGAFVGLLPFAPLMQPPAGQAKAAWLAQCVARAAALPLDRSVKADFLAGLAILSGLVYNPQMIMATVSKEHLMDLIRESSFAQYLAESAREEGIKQGIEQGIEQGIQESIQEVLELRFQPEGMHPLAARLAAIDDVQCLKQLHRAAIQVPSLEAFRHLLER